MELLIPIATIFNFCVIVYYILLQEKMNNNTNEIHRYLLTNVARIKKTLKIEEIKDLKKDL